MFKNYLFGLKRRNTEESQVFSAKVYMNVSNSSYSEMKKSLDAKMVVLVLDRVKSSLYGYRLSSPSMLSALYNADIFQLWPFWHLRLRFCFADMFP
jgi:hypothetical protein